MRRPPWHEERAGRVWLDTIPIIAKRHGFSQFAMVRHRDSPLGCGAPGSTRRWRCRRAASVPWITPCRRSQRAVRIGAEQRFLSQAIAGCRALAHFV